MRQAMKCVVFAVGLLICTSPLGAALQLNEMSQRNPLAKDPSAIQPGKQRFVTSCGACHGSSGTGGRGAKLAGSRHIQDMSDKKIFDTIRNGVPGTDMPSNRLVDQQIWEIVAFIRSLNSVAGNRFVSGDPASGKALFFGAGECSECHSIGGRGGSTGPDLSDVASRRSTENIRLAIVAPSQLIEPGFAEVVVVTTSGQHIEGLVKNESAYSIQLQDLKGSFHSFSKSDVSEIIRNTQSLMPPSTLSREQLQNIVAFLSRQKGAGTAATKVEGRR
jgi:cytochrome c oxidase cbb3-type subunit III